MATSKPTSDEEWKPPILTYEYVLGVAIGDHQRDKSRTEVHAYGSDRTISHQQRRYLAAWARRNLFGGAAPDV